MDDAERSKRMTEILSAADRLIAYAKEMTRTGEIEIGVRLAEIAVWRLQDAKKCRDDKAA